MNGIEDEARIKYYVNTCDPNWVFWMLHISISGIRRRYYSDKRRNKPDNQVSCAWCLWSADIIMSHFDEANWRIIFVRYIYIIFIYIYTCIYINICVYIYIYIYILYISVCVCVCVYVCVSVSLHPSCFPVPRLGDWDTSERRLNK